MEDLHGLLLKELKGHMPEDEEGHVPEDEEDKQDKEFENGEDKEEDIYIDKDSDGEPTGTDDRIEKRTETVKGYMFFLLSKYVCTFNLFQHTFFVITMYDL